jgi:superfamily II DNA or RNA helicase
MLTIVIRSRLEIDASGLKASGVYSILRKRFVHNNPEFYKMKALGFSLHNTPRKILSYQKDGPKITFPRGALPSICELLSDEGIKYTIIDKRLVLPEIGVEYTGHDPRDYQAEGRDVMAEQEQGLILSSCGSGKTEMALQAVASIKQPTLILVHRVPMLKGWIERIEKSLKVDFPIGQLGDGKKKVAPITVAMVQTAINNVDKIKDKFGLVMADEVHHFAARTFQTLVDKFPAKYRIGFTATLKRQDKKDFLIVESFGDRLMEVETEELVERGLIHDVSIKLVPTRFYFDYNYEDMFNRLIEEGKYEEDEDDDFETKMGARRQYLWDRDMPLNDYKCYLKAATENEERNNLIADRVVTEIEKGSSCLVLSARRKHCKVLADIIRSRGHPAFVMLGGSENKQITSHSIEQLRRGTVRCGIATSVIEESVDIINLNRGFITVPTATNEALLEQQMGRFRRKSKGKDDAKLYYFWDNRIGKFFIHHKLLKRRYSEVKVEKVKR